MARTKQTARRSSDKPHKPDIKLPGKLEQLKQRALAEQLKQQRAKRRADRIKMREALARKIGRDMAEEVANKVFELSNYKTKDYVHSMQSIIKTYRYKGNSTMSVDTIINLPETCKKERENQVSKKQFVLTTTRADMVTASQAAEAQQTCKGTMSAHM
jgi:hypothetical protein